jgi:biotin carboxylase
MKTLLVLAAGSLQLPAIITAKRLGLRVVALDGCPDAPGLAQANVGKVVNLLDPDACLAVAKAEQVDGAIHICSEVAMASLGRINQEMGLHGIDVATAARATNKALMRRAFEQGQAPSPPSIAIKTLTEALSAVEQLGFPVIFKPSRNSGSRGITRVGPDGARRETLVEAFAYALRESRDASVVVEKFVEGPEFSVEILVWNGQSHVLAITDKMTTGEPSFVEIGHSQPSLFTKTDQQQIVEAALRGVRALGIDWSAAHAEVRLSPNGPFLMEIGARLGGDFITTELVPRSRGIDMVAGAIRLALGEVPDLTPKHEARGACIRYLTPQPGKVDQIDGVARAKSLPGIKIVEVAVGLGELVPEMNSSLARVGHVIAEGTSAEAAIEAAENARDTISIATTQDCLCAR